jgi:hypothetical protein
LNQALLFHFSPFALRRRNHCLTTLRLPKYLGVNEMSEPL